MNKISVRNILTSLLIFVLLLTSVFAGSPEAGYHVETSGPEMGKLFIDGKDYNSSKDGTFTFGILNVAHFQTLIIAEYLRC